MSEKNASGDTANQAWFLLDNVSTAVFLVDGEARIVKVNDAACRLLNREGEELHHLHLFDLVPELTQDSWVEHWAELREHKTLLHTTSLLTRENKAILARLESRLITWDGKLHQITTVFDISREISAGLTLRERERSHSTLIQNLPGIVYRCENDDHWTMSFISRQIREITGYEPEELIENRVIAYADLIHPEDRQKVWDTVQNAVEDRGQYKLTYRIRTRSGVTKWVSEEGCGVYDATGELRFLEGYIQDVTQQRRQERELWESVDRFRGIFENTTIGMYRTTPDGKIVMANPALVEMLGYSSFDELSQRNLENEGFQPDYDRTAFRRRLEEEGVIHGLESDWKRKDGATIRIRESARAVRDVSGKVLYYEGTVEDLTEKWIAEIRNRQLSQVIEQSPLAVAITDGDNRIEYVNPAFVEQTGFTLEDIREGAVDLIRSNIHSDDFFQEMIETVLSGETWAGEIYNKRKDGEFYWVASVVSPVIDENGKIMNIVYTERDITERKRLEGERNRLETELGRQMHLSQIGLLASGITHNLRGPLGNITMRSSFALKQMETLLDALAQDHEKEYGIVDTLSNHMHKLLQSAHTLDEMISEIMTYHQMNATPEGERKDLNEILRSDIAMLKADLDIKHNIELKLQLHSEPIPVRMASADITQIFLNLVANARDAMLKWDDRHITVASGKDSSARKGWFEVRDTGPGIPDHIRERMGQPFLTTKRQDPGARKRGSGTGLGIYMITRVLEQHHGKMDVDSKPGNTCIRICIPLANEKKEPECGSSSDVADEKNKPDEIAKGR